MPCASLPNRRGPRLRCCSVAERGCYHRKADQHTDYGPAFLEWISTGTWPPCLASAAWGSAVRRRGGRRAGSSGLGRRRAVLTCSADPPITRARVGRFAGVVRVTGALTVLVLLVAACGGSDAEPTATEVIELVPIDQFGELSDGWTEEGRVVGECFSSSSVSERPDAFRCSTVDSSLHDPCFAAAETDLLVCNPDPWERTALLFEAQAMPWDDSSYQSVDSTLAPAADRQPWALEVEVDGEVLRCSPVSGTSTSVAGRRVTFGCDADSSDLLAITRGDDGVWTADMPREGRIVGVPVLRAWV